MDFRKMCSQLGLDEVVALVDAEGVNVDSRIKYLYMSQVHGSRYGVDRYDRFVSDHRPADLSILDIEPSWK